MKRKNLRGSTGIRFIASSLVLLFLTSPCVSLCSSKVISMNPSMTVDGRILYAPMDSQATYLINSDGSVNHIWLSQYFPGEMVRWLGDGSILRTIKVSLSGVGGSGGGIQRVTWDGSVTWDYRYNTEQNLSHHDIMPLPNGNVLMIAWEKKTRTEAIAAGRNPATITSDTFMPDHLIEVKPTGPTSGQIVWEWHVWDHLIQDYDPTAANYGDVAQHPELIDLNYGIIDPLLSDWLHTDSIDYNPQFNQILLSVHNFNEIWVIDHSTTTQQAAGHTGGRSGKGGDLLYRWGNPQAYRVGTAADDQLFGQHDAAWIKPGYPGEGDILIFNNGFNRPTGIFSTVVEIIPPVNETGVYTLQPGAAYGPDAPIWSYEADPPASRYSGLFSGAQRLTDGNTLICDGAAGRFFEVTPYGDTVWEYLNMHPNPVMNNIFKIVFIPTEVPNGPNLHCIGSFSWTRIRPGQTVTGSFQVQNIGSSGSRLNWTTNTSSLTWGTWSCQPAHEKNLLPTVGSLTVNVTVTAPDQAHGRFEGYLRVENTQDPTDFELIPVTLKTPVITQHFPFLWQLLHQILQRHPLLEKIADALPQTSRPFFS